MSGPLHPSQGARFLFERRSIAPEQGTATYRAAIITPDQRYELDVVLHLDGTAELTPVGALPPENLMSRITAHARQAARAAERRRADQLSPWPHRILRWRDG